MPESQDAASSRCANWLKPAAFRTWRMVAIRARCRVVCGCFNRPGASKRKTRHNHDISLSPFWPHVTLQPAYQEGQGVGGTTLIGVGTGRAIGLRPQSAPKNKMPEFLPK